MVVAVESPSAHSVEEGTEASVVVTPQPRLSVYSLPESHSLSSPSPPVRRKRFQRAAAALAAVVFFLSSFALLLTCRKLSSKLTEPGLAHRRLAEGFEKEITSDEELDAILNQCLELEAEHGEPHPDPDSDSAEPAAKKAKLVALLEEAAVIFELLGPETTPADGGLSTSSSWTHATEPEGLSSTHPSRTQSASETTLAHFNPSLHAGPTEDVSLPGLDVDPNLDPEGYLEQIPLLTEEEGEEERETDEGLTVLHAEGEQEQQPATSSGTQQLGFEDHPFFRLPQVLPHAIRRKFEMIEEYRLGYSGSSCFLMLQKMHELFLKPVLDPDDVEELLCASESLARYAHTHVHRDRLVRVKPVRVIRQLGLHFIILDSLVCARQLLGSYMIPEEWWDPLMSSFSTDYALQLYSRAKPITKFNYDLITRLRAAVELLKTGVRPEAEEIVNLKKMLFCSPYSAARFKETHWDLWRQDAEMYEKTHGDSSGSSGDGES
ncbi:hypothetical protein Emed_006498 [Eimeria media]